MEKDKLIKYSRNNSKSFYTWCNENNEEWLLEYWNTEVTGYSPEKIPCSTDKQAFFNCPRGIHNGEWTTINNITGYKHFRKICRRCYSFEQYCIDSGNDWLDRWDYKLNEKLPSEVMPQSGKEYWFKCLNNPNHHSELKMLSNFVKQDGSRRCCQCESFGTWAINNVDNDFINKYWSNKNTINPFEISYRSEVKYFFKCQKCDYHENYVCSIANFVGGRRCPYCNGKKVLYQDSLGYKYPKILDYWSDKNDKSPYEYTPHSNKQIIFKCDEHGEYKRRISGIVKSGIISCKYCDIETNISKFQSKVYEYFRSLGYNVKTENECTLNPINPLTGYYLKYDNQIDELKLICEVNGLQHYKENKNSYFTQCTEYIRSIFDSNLKYQQFKDIFKMQHALLNGYYFLEIPYYLENKDKYKKVIDDKIKEIINNQL